MEMSLMGRESPVLIRVPENTSLAFSAPHLGLISDSGKNHHNGDEV
jgi:hypothetical protein